MDNRSCMSQLPTHNGEHIIHAVVSVSGGMDSTACLFYAVRQFGAQNILAVSFAYGQKHDREIEAARNLCRKLNVEHDIRDITDLYRDCVSSLLKQSREEIEQGKTYSEIEGVPSTYVPVRNKVFADLLCLSGLVHGYADGANSWAGKPLAIIMGMHADDAGAAYPDCTPEFAMAENESLQQASDGLVYLHTPLINMKKSDVAQFGIQFGMSRDDFDATWSCYLGGKKQCGKCPTCIDRIHALIDAGLYDSPEMLMERYDVTRDEACALFKGHTVIDAGKPVNLYSHAVENDYGLRSRDDAD